jgi:hypothetical protein
MFSRLMASFRGVLRCTDKKEFVIYNADIPGQIIHLNGCGPAPTNCKSILSPNSTIGLNTNTFIEMDVEVSQPEDRPIHTTCSVRHGGGRSKKINAWYLNTHMVYL